MPLLNPGARDLHAAPEVSPNCFDKGACFYLMLGFSRLVIDAGLSEAAALIVFKTTYLSYECFIQETKYELAGWEPPQEHWGTEDSCMLIMALERVEERKRVMARKRKKVATMSSIHWLPYIRISFFCTFLPSLSITLSSCYQQQKFYDKLPKTEK